MTKGDVATRLVGMFPDLKRTEAQNLTEAVFAIVTQSLVSGKDGVVRIHGFGTFEVTERAARTGRNPKTGETIAIPARKMVRFRPSSTLKDAL